MRGCMEAPHGLIIYPPEKKNFNYQHILLSKRDFSWHTSIKFVWKTCQIVQNVKKGTGVAAWESRNNQTGDEE